MFCTGSDAIWVSQSGAVSFSGSRDCAVFASRTAEMARVSAVLVTLSIGCASQNRTLVVGCFHLVVEVLELLVSLRGKCEASHGHLPLDINLVRCLCALRDVSSVSKRHLGVRG